MDNLNNKIKVFFIDLDGTLLDAKKDDKHWISQQNIDAIKKVQGEGKEVVVSTGRYGLGVQDFMKATNVKYAVTANGATVVNNKGKIFKDDKLTLQQSLLLFDIAKRLKLIIKLDGDKESYGAFSWIQKFISKKFGFFPNNNFNMPMHKQYSKIVLWGKTKSKVREYCDLISKEVPGVSVVSSSKGWTIEVTNNKSTKGLGNLYVANKILKITKREEMVHIGDTLNDSTVVEYMDLIAVGNATKELKEKANYIGPNSKVGGVAKILNGEYKKIER